jgi:hypothetical protein
MKIEVSFKGVKPAETGGVQDRYDLDAAAVVDLLARASRAVSRARSKVAAGEYGAAAEASGQAMMLTRHAEMGLRCSVAARHAALLAISEQPVPYNPDSAE